MFVEAGGQHHTAHFHAYYQEHVGIYDIVKVERLAGSLPRRQERLVLFGKRCKKVGLLLKLIR